MSGVCWRRDGGSVLPSSVFVVDDQFAVMESRGENVSRTSGMTCPSRRLCGLSARCSVYNGNMSMFTLTEWHSGLFLLARR